MSFGTLSRRTLLRGMGAAMALPWLEAMAATKTSSPTEAGAGTKPRRFACLYMPNGTRPDRWTPEGEGSTFQLSPILSPLQAHQSELLVLTQLWNAATNTGDGHYVKTGGFLTSTTITRTTGADLCSGNTSMDQWMARQVGHLTPLPSLELGIEPITTGVDTNVGFTRLYGSHISWATPTTPCAKEINPRRAFDRLFRNASGLPASRFGDNSSVLDLVAGDAQRLKQQLGKADQQKLTEYFESVRSVEHRIEWAKRRAMGDYLEDPAARAEIQRLGQRIDVYSDPAQASQRGIDHTEQVRLMLDIMALAFWTDSTRVSTFMFGNAVSGRNFSFLDGVKGGHHEYSHHENRPEKLAPYERITRWHIEQYAYFLGRLRSMKEGTGSVLDQSMILFGAGMRDGNGHNPRNLPLVLAGRGGGTLNPGRHLVFSKDSPMANLHLGLMRRMGVRADRFADSTNALPELGDAEA